MGVWLAAQEAPHRERALQSPCNRLYGINPVLLQWCRAVGGAIAVTARDRDHVDERNDVSVWCTTAGQPRHPLLQSVRTSPRALNINRSAGWAQRSAWWCIIIRRRTALSFSFSLSLFLLFIVLASTANEIQLFVASDQQSRSSGRAIRRPWREVNLLTYLQGVTLPGDTLQLFVGYLLKIHAELVRIREKSSLGKSKLVTLACLLISLHLSFSLSFSLSFPLSTASTCHSILSIFLSLYNTCYFLFLFIVLRKTCIDQFKMLLHLFAIRCLFRFNCLKSFLSFFFLLDIYFNRSVVVRIVFVHYPATLNII